MPKINALVRDRINAEAGSILNTRTDWVNLTNKTSIIKSSANLTADRPGAKLQEILGFELGIYDTIYSGDALQLKPAYWAHPSILHYDNSDTYTQTNCNHIADLARYGGTTINNITVRPNSIIILDFENSPFNSWPAESILQVIRWIRERWPEGYIAAYGWSMPVESDDIGVNLDHWEAMSEPHVAWFDSKVQRYAEVYQEMDAFAGTFYLLGPGVETRDIAGYGNMSDRLRYNFPGLDQFAFIWGAYHTSWNPPNSYIQQPWLDAYIEASVEIFDGVSVWSENSLQYLVPRLQEYDKSRLIKPAYRATTPLHTPLYRF